MGQLDNFLNKVIEGDCLEVMRAIPDNSIDMILCDLPYNITNNHWDSIIPLDKLWDEYRRITKDNSAIVLTAAGKFTIDLAKSAYDLFKYRLVWVKSQAKGFLNAKIRPLKCYEDILIFYKRQPIYNPQKTPGKTYYSHYSSSSRNYGITRGGKTAILTSGRYPTDVLFFKDARQEGPLYHPTQKPVKLGQWLIRTYTNPGDVVLDNACGSGSFLVAAKREGRNFIGIEKNEGHLNIQGGAADCIDVCNRRLAELEGYTYEDASFEQLRLI